MNNNWGGDPLRPNYGGDPAYVQNEMLEVNALLGLPAHGGHLALHWYEWDTLGYALGSNRKRSSSPLCPSFHPASEAVVTRRHAVRADGGPALRLRHALSKLLPGSHRLLRRNQGHAGRRNARDPLHQRPAV